MSVAATTSFHSIWSTLIHTASYKTTNFNLAITVACVRMGYKFRKLYFYFHKKNMLEKQFGQKACHTSDLSEH